MDNKELLRLKNEFVKWKRDGGNEVLLIEHNLNSNSIVFDIGSYIGIWSKNIFNKYNCNIYSFEPVKQFYQKSIQKNKNEKIQFYNFGLGDKTYKTKIFLNNDSSGLYKKNNKFEDIQMVDIKSFIEQNPVEIDLMKINIEGGEYVLLNRILDNNINVKSFVIQFHHYDKNYKELRNTIIKKLEKQKYKCDWFYDEIWEKWTKNK